MLCYFPRWRMGSSSTWWQVRDTQKIILLCWLETNVPSFVRFCLTLSLSCRKLFELLVLSSALSELTWPAILSKRHIFRYCFSRSSVYIFFKLNFFPPFWAPNLCSLAVTSAVVYFRVDFVHIIFVNKVLYREVFADFDPVAVSKLNEKKMVAPGTAASSLLSELKLRATIENARQISKVD